MSGWTSVKDGMPRETLRADDIERSNDVLVVLENRLGQRCIDINATAFGEWGFYSKVNCCDWHVTHWMELPELP